MAEPLLRVLVIGGAMAVALGVALLFRRLERGRVARARLDLSSLSSPITLFSDAGCTRCDHARSMLIAADVEFEEIRYDHHPEVIEAVGVTGVPLIVARAPDGAELDRIVGRVTKQSLRRLISRV